VLAHVDLKTAQTGLGNSDPRLTLAVYAQATSEADRAAADLLGQRFFESRAMKVMKVRRAARRSTRRCS
jgi:hypothetical protein